LVVICCAIAYLALPVTSNENVYNGHLTAYVPGIIQDIWHVPDFIAFPKDGSLPNAVSGFVPAFPMPYDLQTLLERRNSFLLKIMKPFWSEPADTKVFQKGELLHLQVSASPAPGQQLYVQSCHASSSPNHADKPEVSLIINNGCVASKESLVKFVMQKSDTVNFFVNTSSLKSSESYIHCKVYLTDLGLTSATKFCNYNKRKSRWVDLGGQTSVCDCCGKRCRSAIEHAVLPVSLDLTAVVSSGQLIIKDEPSAPQTTPLTLANRISTSSPATVTQPDKRWIMASDSFSGSSAHNYMDDVSHWPIQPIGGGVVIISQGQGADLSMWLPEITGFEINPVGPLGIGHPEKPAVDVTVQLENLIPDQSAFKKSQAVDEPKVDVETVDSNDYVVDDDLSMWDPKDFYLMSELDTKPVDAPSKPEKPHLNFESVFNLPLNDQPDINPAPEKLSGSAEEKDETVFRRAEVVFKDFKEAELPEPVFYSKLSLNRAADGSSSLTYEEQKRPSVRKQENKTSKKEKNGEKTLKNEMKDTSEIKELVLPLLNQLR
ncbi:zona pellucida protein C, partial [Danio aesculapii]|uniref:zona pellucida protein C n=1 Tax=Danio aesculapii TaxID=1142201 RepID=UPI0024C06906